MNDFEKIEHLLLSKKFEELSPTEVKEVNDYFENATDYNDMRDTLMQVKSTLAADKLLIKPSVELKEKLLQQFDKTYTNHSGGGSLGKKRPFYKNVAFQWSAAASVVVIISLSIFGYIQNLDHHKSDGMAQNYESPKNNQGPGKESTVLADESKPAGTEEINEETTTVGNDHSVIISHERIGSTQNDNEVEKPKLYGNFYTTESEVGEGDISKTQNAPITSNNDILTFSSNRDNTTLGGSNNADLKEEKKDDHIMTNAYRQDDQLKAKDEDKNLELNTTIPNENQGMTNTTVDYNQKSTKKEYWSKKKNKGRLTKTDNVKNELSKATLTLNTDSNTVKSDSLKLDSNKYMLDNDKGTIQMNDNKK